MARVTSQTNTSIYAKAGVMFRDTSAVGSMFVDVVTTLSGVVNMQWRNSTGGSCGGTTLSGVPAPSPSSPAWLKLVKTGSLYTGYYSPDGVHWTLAGSVSLNFSGSTYLAGLAVTAHNNSASSTATLDNFTLTAASAGSLPSGWADADVGAGVPALAGSASYLPSPSGGGAGGEGAFTLSGGGGDIWFASDHFNFASQTTSGDQTLVARVTGQTASDPWAKAGVMFRDMLPSTSGGGAGGGGTSPARCSSIWWPRPAMACRSSGGAPLAGSAAFPRSAAWPPPPPRTPSG